MWLKPMECKNPTSICHIIQGILVTKTKIGPLSENGAKIEKMAPAIYIVDSLNKNLRIWGHWSFV